MSEADVGVMEVEAEPSHQYTTIFCCHETAAEGSLTKKNIWYRNAYEAKVRHWISPCRIKNWPTDINWHLLHVYGDKTVEVAQWDSRMLQQWWQRCERLAMFQTVMQIFTEHSIPALVHQWWKCITDENV